MFSQVADIKVAEDLNLPVPNMATGKPIIVISKPSDYVKEYIMRLATRADAIRNGNVDPSEDNMLKITGEGKAVAIDARLVDPNAPVDFGSKVYKCCDNVYDLYLKTNSDKGCQLVFLDTGLMLYNKVKDELINKGINPNEIAFIHDANTEEQKAELFAKCRNGDVRVLLGSTQKMGAGTNIQERLIGVHHLDCPWRPADISQRDGRILRQGNMYDEVYVYRYVTENTFDAYLWGIQENKQKFITQVITNRSAVRSCDDVDGAVLDCAEVKMLATGDSRVKDKMQLDNDVYMLQIEKSAYVKERIKLQKILTEYPQRIDNANIKLDFVSEDIKMLTDNKKEDFSIELNGINFNDRVKASEMLGAIIKLNPIGEKVNVGHYCGFQLIAEKNTFFEAIKLHIKGKYENTIDLGGSDIGNITRLENGCGNLETIKLHTIENIENLKKQIADAGQELSKPFAKENELQEKLQKQVALNSEMELDSQSPMIMKEDDGNEISSEEVEITEPVRNDSLIDRLKSSEKKANELNSVSKNKFNDLSI